MIRNYINTFFRNYRKHFSNNTFLISGLAISFAAITFLVSFTYFESNFDGFHKNRDSLYRLEMHIKNQDQIISSNAATFAGVKPLLDEYPAVEESVRLKRKSGVISSNHNKAVIRNLERKVYYADNTFFDLFEFVVIAGDLDYALDEVNSIVLTETMANKYFPNLTTSAIIGKALTKKGSLEDETLQVTAVIEDLPRNTHFDIEAIIPYQAIYQWKDSDDTDYQNAAETAMEWNGFYTYFQSPTVPTDAFQKIADEVAARTDGRQQVSLSAQKISDIHTMSKVSGDFKPAANTELLQYLTITIWFILLITLLNYINLFISRLQDSSKELGIRLVSGSTALNLFLKAVVDSTLTLIIALALTVGVVVLSHKPVEVLIDGSISLEVFLQPDLIISIVVSLLIWILGSSFISTWLTARLNVTEALKGRIQMRNQRVWRATLLGINYVVATALVFATTIAARQYLMLTSGDLGFEANNKMIVRAPKSLTDSKMESFRNELKQYASVKEVSFSVTHPGTFHREMGLVVGKDNEKYFFRINGVHHSFIDAYEFPIVAGSKFDKGKVIPELVEYNQGRVDLGTDDHTAIINEAAARMIGYADASRAIGEELFLFGAKKRIIGVIEDFHLVSLKDNIEPLLIYRQAVSLSNITVTFNETTDLSVIDKAWNKVFTNANLEYYQLSDVIYRNYQEDQRFLKIVFLFTFLICIICLISLWSLTLYNFQNRLKELTIRSICGAGSNQLIGLLLRQTLIVVAIGFTIGLVVVYPQMRDWLSNYSTRIQIGIQDFMFPLLVVVVISSFAVVLYLLKLKSINPTSNLNAE